MCVCVCVCVQNKLCASSEFSRKMAAGELGSTKVPFSSKFVSQQKETVHRRGVGGTVTVDATSKSPLGQSPQLLAAM